MAEHAHLQNDSSEDLCHSSFVRFLYVLHCWNKVMLIISLLPFVITSLFKTRFDFSLHHYGKDTANVK